MLIAKVCISVKYKYTFINAWLFEKTISYAP